MPNLLNNKTPKLSKSFRKYVKDILTYYTVLRLTIDNMCVRTGMRNCACVCCKAP